MAREKEDRIEELRTEELKEVEAALAALAPRSDRLDRDRLMFLAGQRSKGAMPTLAVGMRSGHAHASVGMAPLHGARARWAWPSSFAAMSAVAATLLAMLLSRPEPQVVERIKEVPVAGKAAPEDASLPESPRYSVHSTPYSAPGSQYAALTPHPFSPDSYHELLKRVLDRGMDAWKPPAESSGVTVTAAPPVGYRELLETMLESPAT